jgi:hypothetical protein
MMSMIPFTRDDLKALMETRQNPSVTIYLPVQRVGAETRHGQVRLKAQLKKADAILRGQNWRQPLIEHILQPIEALAGNTLFWEYQQQGLGVFASEAGMQTRLLPYAVGEILQVSDRFYTRPLSPLLLHDTPYYLLSLNLNEVKVYQGSRYHIEPLAVAGLPRSLQEVWDGYETEKQLQQHGGPRSGALGGTTYHGSENTKDFEKIRVEEYFRRIDACLNRELAADRRPLVVACVDYLFHQYKQISRYAPLMNEHIIGSPDAIPADALCQAAWAIVQPVISQARDKAWTAGQNLSGSPRLLGNIRQIIAAALHGRVESLFLPAGRQIPGLVEQPGDKAVRLHDLEAIARGEAADLLDVAAVETFLRGGDIYETEPDSLPQDADAWAILRY